VFLSLAACKCRAQAGAIYERIAAIFSNSVTR
jgi:hypothetical protein